MKTQSPLIRGMLFILLICSYELIFSSERSEPAILAQFIAHRTNTKVVIDGVLSEAIWQKPGVSDFYQREPNQGEPSSEKTEVWVTYDNDAIYVAAKLFDSAPDSILRNLARRDYSTLSDQFYIYLDTYHDKRTGFFFGITPAGQLKDGIMQNDEERDMSWDGVWEGRSQITDFGWTIELRIPFSQLRFKEQPEYIWGINFRRDIRRKNEESYLVYTPRNQSGFTSRFPELIGLSDIKPPQRFEVKPYLTTKAEYLKHTEGDPFNDGSKYSPGLGVDLKYGLGTNLTLDATLNPDFGQVEVDPAVVNLSDVETFFSEQRPFFLEGSSIFNFGRGGANSNSSYNWSTPNLFYTRRIGRSPQGSVQSYDFINKPAGTSIIGAGKITGRIFNDWKFGAIQALTDREFAKIQLNGSRMNAEVEPLSYYGVVRTQRDFDKGKQGLGILTTFTNRFFKDDNLKNQMNGNALVTGIDGWTFLDSDRKYVITGYIIGSRIQGSEAQMIRVQRNSTHYFQRPDLNLGVDSSATCLSGYAGRVSLNKQKGPTLLNAAFGIISPGFEANDLGYQTKSNIINWHVSSGYNWQTPTKYYRSIYLSAALFQTKDFDWNTNSGGIFISNSIQLANYYNLGMFYTFGIPSFNTRTTRGGPAIEIESSQGMGFNINTNGSKPVVGHFNINHDLYMGSSTNYHAGVEFKPWSNFSYSTCINLYKNNNNIQWVGSYQDPLATETYGRRYIFGEINQTELSANIRLDWLFSPNLSLQLYLQPFISAGKFQNIKFLEQARTNNFIVYGEDNSTIQNETTTDGDIIFKVDADGNGASPEYQISNPDFRTVSLRGNAVLRWEFKSGSTLYLVWNHNRFKNISDGDFVFNRSMNDMFNNESDNIFMIKLSYWLGR